MSSGRKKSEIWSYFVVKEDAHFVECNKCNEQISRGGKNSKIFNTTNLVQDLRKHSEEFKKYEKRTQMHLMNHRHRSNCHLKKQRIG